MTDDMFDDDDLFGGEGGDPSDAEREFLALADRNIQILNNPRKYSADERVRAAQWLGNSTDARAIHTLVKVYQRDKKNKAVQKAAKDALGQFKALDEAIKRGKGESVIDALNRDENRHITDLIVDIIVNGKQGKRAPRRALMIFNVFLVVILAVVLVAALLIPERTEDLNAKYIEQLADFSGSPAERELAYLQLLSDDLNTDARAMQSTLNTPAPNCLLSWRDPAPYTPLASLNGSVPEIGVVVSTYGNLFTRWQAVKGTFDRACDDHNNAVPDDARRALLSQTIDLTDDLPELSNQLLTARAAVNQQSEMATATAEALATVDAIATAEASITPTITPEPTATPGIPPEQLTRILNDLYEILDSAQNATATLNQYWVDVRNTGRGQGCTSARPSIREDYQLPQNYGEFLPDLQTATDLVNVGLNLTRGGWDTYYAACGSGTFANQIDTGIATAITATNAYAAAREILNQLSER